MLHKAVKESRLLRSSIEMEEELLAKHHEIYSKKGVVQETGEDGDTTENEDEDAFVVDGFDCEELPMPPLDSSTFVEL